MVRCHHHRVLPRCRFRSVPPRVLFSNRLLPAKMGRNTNGQNTKSAGKNGLFSCEQKTYLSRGGGYLVYLSDGDVPFVQGIVFAYFF